MRCVALCRLDALVEGQARGFDPQGQGTDSLFVLRHGASYVPIETSARTCRCRWNTARTVS